MVQAKTVLLEAVFDGVFRLSGFDKLAETLLTVRNCLYSMADKVPSEETGTYSTHFGENDQRIINRVGWEGVGPGPILTRALEDVEQLHDLKQLYNRFLQGDVNLGRLMRELNQL